jgi:hypothetical protein
VRTVLAFTLAPLAPAALAWLLSLVGVAGTKQVFVLSALYSYPIAAVFGIPAYFYLRRRNQLDLLHTLAAGAIAGGILPFALLALLSGLALFAGSTSDSGGTNALLTALVLGVGMGCLTALAFWLIAFAPRWRAP